VKPKILPIRQQEDWQRQLRSAISSADQLLAMLDLKADQVGFSDQASKEFALRVPLAFASRMKIGDPQDPLLLQVISSQQEMVETPGYSHDPVGETGRANPVKGVIHKYQGRALLIVSSGCAINCRYCFRRHFPYADNQNSRREWREALQYIAAAGDITEVILSGGDPLLVGNNFLDELVTQIAAIPQVRRLRIHSRLPVVIPDRVDTGLLKAIRRPGLQTIMVIHSNHANEIDTSVEAALARMTLCDITLLNQAVLLARVNDNVQALSSLSERLFAAGVLPYYLHLLDKVQGAAHFDVPKERAKDLHAEITASLPGYLVPKLVREVAGARSKVAI
jgi:EF-P beta-lysylation protein EpmB